MATVCIFWEKLLEIQDPQVAFHLIRLCASTCRLFYLLRTTPPHITKPQAKEFDLGMRRVFENLHGGVPDASWNYDTLPFHSGGMGLTPAALCLIFATLLLYSLHSQNLRNAQGPVLSLPAVLNASVENIALILPSETVTAQAYC